MNQNPEIQLKSHELRNRIHEQQYQQHQQQKSSDFYPSQNSNYQDPSLEIQEKIIANNLITNNNNSQNDQQGYGLNQNQQLNIQQQQLEFNPNTSQQLNKQNKLVNSNNNIININNSGNQLIQNNSSHKNTGREQQNQSIISSINYSKYLDFPMRVGTKEIKANWLNDSSLDKGLYMNMIINAFCLVDIRQNLEEALQQIQNGQLNPNKQNNNTNNSMMIQSQNQQLKQQQQSAINDNSVVLDDYRLEHLHYDRQLITDNPNVQKIYKPNITAGERDEFICDIPKQVYCQKIGKILGSNLIRQGVIEENALKIKPNDTYKMDKVLPFIYCVYYVEEKPPGLQGQQQFDSNDNNYSNSNVNFNNQNQSIRPNNPNNNKLGNIGQQFSSSFDNVDTVFNKTSALQYVESSALEDLKWKKLDFRFRIVLINVGGQLAILQQQQQLMYQTQQLQYQQQQVNRSLALNQQQQSQQQLFQQQQSLAMTQMNFPVQIKKVNKDNIACMYLPNRKEVFRVLNLIRISRLMNSLSPSRSRLPKNISEFRAFFQKRIKIVWKANYFSQILPQLFRCANNITQLKRQQILPPQTERNSISQIIIPEHSLSISLKQNNNNINDQFQKQVIEKPILPSLNISNNNNIQNEESNNSIFKNSSRQNNFANVIANPINQLPASQNTINQQQINQIQDEDFDTAIMVKDQQQLIQNDLSQIIKQEEEENQSQVNQFQFNSQQQPVSFVNQQNQNDNENSSPALIKKHQINQLPVNSDSIEAQQPIQGSQIYYNNNSNTNNQTSKNLQNLLKYQNNQNDGNNEINLQNQEQNQEKKNQLWVGSSFENSNTQNLSSNTQNNKYQSQQIVQGQQQNYNNGSLQNNNENIIQAPHPQQYDNQQQHQTFNSFNNNENQQQQQFEIGINASQLPVQQQQQQQKLLLQQQQQQLQASQNQQQQQFQQNSQPQNYVNSQIISSSKISNETSFFPQNNYQPYEQVQQDNTFSLQQNNKPIMNIQKVSSNLSVDDKEEDLSFQQQQQDQNSQEQNNLQKQQIQSPQFQVDAINYKQNSNLQLQNQSFSQQHQQNPPLQNQTTPQLDNKSYFSHRQQQQPQQDSQNNAAYTTPIRPSQQEYINSAIQNQSPIAQTYTIYNSNSSNNPNNNFAQVASRLRLHQLTDNQNSDLEIQQQQQQDNKGQPINYYYNRNNRPRQQQIEEPGDDDNQNYYSNNSFSTADRLHDRSASPVVSRNNQNFQNNNNMNSSPHEIHYRNKSEFTPSYKRNNNYQQQGEQLDPQKIAEPLEYLDPPFKTVTFGQNLQNNKDNGQQQQQQTPSNKQPSQMQSQQQQQQQFSPSNLLQNLIKNSVNNLQLLENCIQFTLLDLEIFSPFIQLGYELQVKLSLIYTSNSSSINQQQQQPSIINSQQKSVQFLPQQKQQQQVHILQNQLCTATYQDNRSNGLLHYTFSKQHRHFFVDFAKLQESILAFSNYSSNKRGTALNNSNNKSPTPDTEVALGIHVFDPVLNLELSQTKVQIAQLIEEEQVGRDTWVQVQITSRLLLEQFQQQQQSKQFQQQQQQQQQTSYGFLHLQSFFNRKYAANFLSYDAYLLHCFSTQQYFHDNYYFDSFSLPASAAAPTHFDLLFDLAHLLDPLWVESQLPFIASIAKQQKNGSKTSSAINLRINPDLDLEQEDELETGDQEDFQQQQGNQNTSGLNGSQSTTSIQQNNNNNNAKKQEVPPRLRAHVSRFLLHYIYANNMCRFLSLLGRSYQLWTDFEHALNQLDNSSFYTNPSKNQFQKQSQQYFAISQQQRQIRQQQLYREYMKLCIDGIPPDLRFYNWQELGGSLRLLQRSCVNLQDYINQNSASQLFSPHLVRRSEVLQLFKNLSSVNNSSPRQNNGQPQKFNGQPQQINGQPQQINGQPQKFNGQPQKFNGQPQKINGQPQKINGQPQQQNGQPQTSGPEFPEEQQVLLMENANLLYIVCKEEGAHMVCENTLQFLEDLTNREQLYLHGVRHEVQQLVLCCMVNVGRAFYFWCVSASDSLVCFQHQRALLSVLEKICVLNLTTENELQEDQVFWTLVNIATNFLQPLYYGHVLNNNNNIVLGEQDGRVNSQQKQYLQVARIKQLLFYLNFFVQKHLREVFDRVSELGGSLEFFFAEPMLSLYAGFFNDELLFRLWDLLFVKLQVLHATSSGSQGIYQGGNGVNSNNNFQLNQSYHQPHNPDLVLVAAAFTLLQRLQPLIENIQSFQELSLLIATYAKLEINFDDFIQQVLQSLQLCFSFNNNNSQSNSTKQKPEQPVIITEAIAQEKFLLYQNTVRKIQERQILQNAALTRFVAEDQLSLSLPRLGLALDNLRRSQFLQTAKMQKQQLQFQYQTPAKNQQNYPQQQINSPNIQKINLNEVPIYNSQLNTQQIFQQQDPALLESGNIEGLSALPKTTTIILYLFCMNLPEFPQLSQQQQQRPSSQQPGQTAKNMIEMKIIYHSQSKLYAFSNQQHIDILANLDYHYSRISKQQFSRLNLNNNKNKGKNPIVNSTTNATAINSSTSSPQSRQILQTLHGFEEQEQNINNNQYGSQLQAVGNDPEEDYSEEDEEEEIVFFSIYDRQSGSEYIAQLDLELFQHNVICKYDCPVFEANSQLTTSTELFLYPREFTLQLSVLILPDLEKQHQTLYCNNPTTSTTAYGSNNPAQYFQQLLNPQQQQQNTANSAFYSIKQQLQGQQQQQQQQLQQQQHSSPSSKQLQHQYQTEPIIASTSATATTTTKTAKSPSSPYSRTHSTRLSQLIQLCDNFAWFDYFRNWHKRKDQLALVMDQHQVHTENGAYSATKDALYYRERQLLNRLADVDHCHNTLSPLHQYKLGSQFPRQFSEFAQIFGAIFLPASNASSAFFYNSKNANSDLSSFNNNNKLYQYQTQQQSRYELLFDLFSEQTSLSTQNATITVPPSPNNINNNTSSQRRKSPGDIYLIEPKNAFSSTPPNHQQFFSADFAIAATLASPGTFEQRARVLFDFLLHFERSKLLFNGDGNGNAQEEPPSINNNSSKNYYYESCGVKCLTNAAVRSFLLALFQRAQTHVGGAALLNMEPAINDGAVPQVNIALYHTHSFGIVDVTDFIRAQFLQEVFAKTLQNDFYFDNEDFLALFRHFLIHQKQLVQIQPGDLFVQYSLSRYQVRNLTVSLEVHGGQFLLKKSQPVSVQLRQKVQFENNNNGNINKSIQQQQLQQQQQQNFLAQQQALNAFANVLGADKSLFSLQSYRKYSQDDFVDFLHALPLAHYFFACGGAPDMLLRAAQRLKLYKEKPTTLMAHLHLHSNHILTLRLCDQKFQQSLQKTLGNNKNSVTTVFLPFLSMHFRLDFILQQLRARLLLRPSMVVANSIADAQLEQDMLTIARMQCDIFYLQQAGDQQQQLYGRSLKLRLDKSLAQQQLRVNTAGNSSSNNNNYNNSYNIELSFVFYDRRSRQRNVRNNNNNNGVAGQQYSSTITSSYFNPNFNNNPSSLSSSKKASPQRDFMKSGVQSLKKKIFSEMPVYQSPQQLLPLANRLPRREYINLEDYYYQNNFGNHQFYAQRQGSNNKQLNPNENVQTFNNDEVNDYDDDNDDYIDNAEVQDEFDPFLQQQQQLPQQQSQTQQDYANQQKLVDRVTDNGRQFSQTAEKLNDYCQFQENGYEIYLPCRVVRRQIKKQATQITSQANGSTTIKPQLQTFFVNQAHLPYIDKGFYFALTDDQVIKGPSRAHFGNITKQ